MFKYLLLLPILFVSCQLFFHEKCNFAIPGLTESGLSNFYKCDLYIINRHFKVVVNEKSNVEGMSGEFIIKGTLQKKSGNIDCTANGIFGKTIVKNKTIKGTYELNEHIGRLHLIFDTTNTGTITIFSTDFRRT